MINLGDFTTTDTVYIPFATYDSNGASVTLTGLAVTDIEIYKNGVATTRASDNGYTLLDTDGTDFAGNTGIHGISIDLSDNSDIGFYATGATYFVVINSVCGCAAGMARPGVSLALKQGPRPDRLGTVFAGMEEDAVARARSYFGGYPPSSPSIALFSDGELVHFVPRHQIEVRQAVDVANDLIAALERHCAPAA